MTGDDGDEGIEDADPIGTTASTSGYKVLGDLNDDGKVGVLGRNRAGVGFPVGVKGTTPNNTAGYGLATPDNAKVEGKIAATSGHTLSVDFDAVLRLGPVEPDHNGDLAGGNVTGGWINNTCGDAVGGTVAGGGDDGGPNEVADNYGTVGGGSANRAGDSQSGTDQAMWATVAGGQANVARGAYAFVGGGTGNEATRYAAVGGGVDNEAKGIRSTVGGGDSNSVSGNRSTIAGGISNSVEGIEACIGGGKQNELNGSYSTVGGGIRNLVGGNTVTVAGGGDNEARGNVSSIGGGDFNETYGDNSTIGGGQFNRTGKSDTNKGSFATVPGGRDNTAREDFSLAAGRQAKAHHQGSFVWADSRNQDFTSNGTDQFVIEADGGVGIGTNTPFAKLEVANDASGDAFNDPSKHVAIVDDTADSGSANALAIKAGTEDANGNLPTSTNFVSFYNKSGISYGAIQGNGSGGSEFKSTGSDYAEYLPKRDPDRAFEAGDVVGVEGGELVADAADANRAMVVSWSHVVLGNDPGESDDGHEPVAFTGQVPVKVLGPVADGDLLVPSGRGDGTAEAVDPGEWRPGDGPLVGQAWESDDSDGVSEVTVAVGIDDPAVLAVDRDRVSDLEDGAAERDERIASLESSVGAREERIEELASENAALQAELDRKDDRIGAQREEIEGLRERISALEARVTDLATGDRSAPADD